MHELVPIVLFISMFGLIFGIAYIRSRENMAMLEKGLNPRNGEFKLGMRLFTSLKFGLLLLGAGLGLFVAFFVNRGMDHKALTPEGQVYYRDYPEIYLALVAIGGGLGLIISYLIERKSRDKNKGGIA